MPAEARYCSNCRVELPADAEACSECGVYAGDVFDGKLPRKPSRFGLFLPLLILALLGAGAAVWMNKPRPEPPKPVAKTIPPKIVHGRVSEAEAMRVLRRHLAATYGIQNDCVALLSRGMQRDAFVVTAVNGCEHTRLGTWRVDAKSGVVSK